MPRPKMLILASVMTLCVLVIVVKFYLWDANIQEAFDASIADIYAAMNLVNTSDSARRSLVRSALIQTRVQTLNLMRGLATKVPPNCYDAKDPNYDSSNCRAARAQRDAEITAFVNQQIVNFCKSQSDCKPVSRATYVTQTWKKKCDATSKLKLQQVALNNALLTKDTNTWITLPKTAFKGPCPDAVGSVTVPNLTKTPVNALQASVSKIAGVDKATSLMITGNNVMMCSGTKLNAETDLVSSNSSIVMLRKPLSGKIPQEVVNTVMSTDAWLDTYWYFGDDTKIKTTADRLQKCSETLSRDDFLMAGTAAYQAQATQTVGKPVVVTPSGGASDPKASIASTISQYMTQRAVQKYPQTWYLQWQKSLSDMYLVAQQAYNKSSTDLASIQSQPLYVAYKKYQDLIKLAQNDIASYVSDIMAFDGGQYGSAPPCFTPGTETTYTDINCCNLKVPNTSTAFLSYCPEPASVCAQIAKSNPTSKLFRECKDLFSNQINLNNYRAAVQKFMQVPEFKALSDNINVITTAQSSALTDVQSLENALKVNNADVGAAAGT